MKKQKQSRLKIILSMIASLSMIPLVFSSFFSGYKIVTSGTQGDRVVEVAMFEYVTKNDFLLALAFVGSMLSFILIITIIAHSLVSILRDRHDKLIGITFCTIEIILTIMSFVSVLIYCNKNSFSTEGYALKYVLGPSTIIYFVCGLIFGIISLTAYLVSAQKNNKKIKS